MESFSESVSFDQRLYPYDIDGSVAHATMLTKVGVLSKDEGEAIVDGLEAIRRDIDAGRFTWRIDLEDVHMNVEAALTERIGEIGKKLHTARSRNDQVATDVRLLMRDEIDATIAGIHRLQGVIVDLAEREADTIMPGFTHLQTAQPVTLGHHLLAWYEMLDRDGERFADGRRRANRMPLGAAALAGTGFPIDRELTAELLGFEAICANSLDAVADRDFCIEFAAHAALLMVHLSRISEELILWSSAQFDFVELSDAFCTGSSIMPQKKNPDAAELVRGKCGRVVGHLTALLVLMKAQPLSFNRDNQEDKEALFDTIDTVKVVSRGVRGDAAGNDGQARADDPRRPARLHHRHRPRGLPGGQGHAVSRCPCGGRAGGAGRDRDRSRARRFHPRGARRLLARDRSRRARGAHARGVHLGPLAPRGHRAGAGTRGGRRCATPAERSLSAGDSLERLRTRLAAFAAERDWDQFHSPKNLSMALIAECAELVEHFQWLTEHDSSALEPAKLAEVRLELADILIFLVRAADKLDVDLIAAANEKIALNEQRYPADRVRGSAGRRQTTNERPRRRRLAVARVVRRPWPHRPALAAGSDALPGLGIGDHAAADPGPHRHRLLRTLHRALPRCRATRRGRARRGAAPVERTRLLRAGAQPARGGEAGVRAPPRRAAGTHRPAAIAAGIGRSTAGAILALSRGQRHPILDGNVKRVLCRYHAVDEWPGRSPVLRTLWQLAEQHTPEQRCAAYTQAIMDLGAMLCTAKRPACTLCPLAEDCRARLDHRVHELPAPRPRAPLPLRETMFLILRDRSGAVFLERRPPSGIWGGLFGFPECAPDADIASWCREHLGVSPQRVQRLATVHHGFTHYRLDIHPALVDLPPLTGSARVAEAAEVVWQRPDAESQIGLAAPVTALLSKLSEQATR